MAEGRSDRPIVLETERLSRNFGGLQAVRNVSLSLRRGELHAVIGPNGAGKSTLANLLSGELHPSAGSIRLEGQDVTGAAPWTMVQHGIGRSYQRTNIFKSMSVLENARLAAQAVRLPTKDLLKSAAGAQELIVAATDTLTRLGLGEQRDRVAGTLSHGEQRQLEIAMALAADPRVLLLDEPLAGMGPEESARLTRLLEGLARERAILLIEHDMDFVFAVADWMTVMVDGAVLAEGRPETIRADAQVQRAYLGGHA